MGGKKRQVEVLQEALEKEVSLIWVAVSIGERREDVNVF